MRRQVNTQSGYIDSECETELVKPVDDCTVILHQNLISTQITHLQKDMSEHAQDIWAALTVSYFSFSWPLGAVVCVRLRFSESSGLLVFKVEKCKTGSDFLHMNNHKTSPNTNVCVRAVENNDLPCK